MNMRDYPKLHLDTNYNKQLGFYCCSTFHSHSRISTLIQYIDNNLNMWESYYCEFIIIGGTLISIFVDSIKPGN